ncbi:MAG: hypothetical protein AAGD25_32555 [Cyanobacteria bacterium P01_F01_bin.150]
MKQFLQEMWELWYWSMFCPSKLQQRINEWSPAPEKDGQREDTTFREILLVRVNWRFLAQYLAVAIVFCLPLIRSLFNQYQHPMDWLLIPAGIATAYGLGRWSFATLGIHSPLLLALVYSDLSTIDLWGNALTAVSALLSPFQEWQGWIGLGIGLLGVGLSAGVGFTFLKSKQLSWGQWSLIIGNVFSVSLGSWFATQDISTLLVLGGLTGFFLFSNRTSISKQSNPITIVTALALAVTARTVVAVAATVAVGLGAVIASGIASGMTFSLAFMLTGVMSFNLAFDMPVCVAKGAIAIIKNHVAARMINIFAVVSTIVILVIATVGVVGSMVVGMAVGVASIIAGISLLSMQLYLLAAIIVSISLPFIRAEWWIGILLGIWILLGVGEKQSLVFWSIPVLLVGYYRLVPDYLANTLLSWYPFRAAFIIYPAFQNLQLLPPHHTEMLWFPLPNHDRILAEAFRTYPTKTLPILQRMQSQPLPGLPATVRRALPQIVSDQLTAVKTLADLTQIHTLEHPFLPILVPDFYRSATELERSGDEVIESTKSSEIKILLPKFQAIAADMQAALAAGSVVLQQRNLESIRNGKLQSLQNQLSGLGFRQPTINRWQRVIQRWERVIDLELEQKKSEFQGELLNPFTYGNPLRCTESDVFKGRQSFSDEIIRLVLDRNRPTLVLHGPRRCGKSSFLLNLPRLLPSDIIPVYLDMQRQGSSNSDGDFCYALAHAIRRDSRGQGIPLPGLPKRQEFYGNPYPHLDDWLDEALPTLGDRRLLLGLDEFEKIGSAINEGRMTIRILDQLRSLIQHSNQMGFLFSGVQTLDELGPNWSSYFISVVPMKMLYLNPDEAEDLLTNPDPDFDLRYEDGVIDQILHLTRCHPYLVQLLGWSLVKLANQNQTRLATAQLLNDAIPEAFNNGEPYFTNVWTEFTGTTPAQIRAGQTFLLNLAQDHAQILSDPDTQAALRRLIRFHILEQTEKGDRFEIPLMQQWVATRAIVSQ